ncbi:MAG: ornithine carbamoyltransferase [Thaumarchaeota archaeon]|nr:ornithine carbamoyltransferase [Nitrososphaerota archaeon]MBI3116275.1 ornithine carbamoyltransferase [Nitrososphaerota archaeon]
MKKDFLTLAELSPQELQFVLRLSAKFKKRRKKMAPASHLRMRTLALLFQKQSTRTRLSFEVAIRELGGESVTLSMSELQLGRGETPEDTAAVLSRLVHGIIARVNSHEELVRLASASSVPVINGLSDRFHPAQILADLLTLQERKKRLRGLKVAWVGDGNNVCNSWLYGAALSGIDFVVAAPRDYRPLEQAVREAESMTKSTGGTITVLEDPIEAVRDADCVVTDTFVSMGFESDREKRLSVLMPKYTVSEELMSHAKRDAIFEHCMPAHRGEEVTSGVIDGPQSVVLDQAENRLHTAKALLCLVLLGKKARL